MTCEVFGTRMKNFCFMIKSHKTEILCVAIIEHIITSEILSQSHTEVFELDFRHLGVCYSLLRVSVRSFQRT